MNKYDEIMKVKESNPSFDDIELIEKCFGSQSHSHVFCYGGGIKRKHLVESNSSYVKKLEARLLEKEEENGVLQKRIDGIENRLEQIEKDNSQPSMASTRSNDDLHQIFDSSFPWKTNPDLDSSSMEKTEQTWKMSQWDGRRTQLLRNLISLMLMTFLYFQQHYLKAKILVRTYSIVVVL
ncbi:uncharacterized protein LOC130015558 [Mercurialis annua]|uniref:uncharacterized protein LOC130015558 n=1 Tax=Mercurialis annua TaxID=3986 RepID=UPI0024AC897D|nr:uncharacterized protein LOC130015558 [Mercurialis annua]